MTPQDLNKRFAELVGIKPKMFYYYTDAPGTEYSPDFVGEPRLVLVEMMKREDYERFFSSIMPIMHIQGVLHWIEVYILDTTKGLLVKAAIDFMEEK